MPHSLLQMCTLIANIEQTLNQTLMLVPKHLDLQNQFSFQINLLLEQRILINRLLCFVLRFKYELLRVDLTILELRNLK